jgi:lipid-binding SYLF domain-containing protein
MRHILIGVNILLLITSCSSMSVSEKESKRHELDEMAMAAVSGLIENDSSLQQSIDDAPAYAVANMKVTKVPIVGAGGGEGVFVDKKTNERIYFTISRFDIGGGWGVRSYKILLILNSAKVIKRFRNGTWEFQAGVEASAGTASAEGSSGGGDEGYTVHVLSDGGASATATARVIKLKVNKELSY